MKQRGFTIVELLIVIVIIGILAAIVIVAYSNIQQRSKNTQLQSGISQYTKALSLYMSENSFPIDTSGSTNIACLDGGSSCNAAYSATKTAQLKTAVLTKISALPAFPNAFSLVNYATVAKDSGGNFTGWYFLIQQVGQDSCVSLAGTAFLSTTMNGSNRQCRYSIDSAN